MSSSLEGRVALVTGAGSGIGAATAMRLAQAGAFVALLDLVEAGLHTTAEAITRAGGRTLLLTVDVADSQAMEVAVARIKEARGRLDIVVANAGINGLWAPLEDIAVEDWDRTLRVNLRGTFLAVKTALPLLKVQGGAIVIVSSINGTRLFRNSGATAYASSKAAQCAFARMAALELAPHRIRVNTVCPGSIETGIGASTEERNLASLRARTHFSGGGIPLTRGRAGSAEHVGELIQFLVSDAAGHITGTEVFVDGGESLL